MTHVSNKIQWNAVATRTVVCCALCVATVWITACGELEPMIEPEVADLQLTIDTLKTQVRDAQRAVGEMRTELEARRQELADAHVARAQLEGRVREAERRVAEARHVIALQREELVAARGERERISRSSMQLQSQIKHLQKQLAKLSGSKEGGSEATPASQSGSGRKAQKMAVGMIPDETPDTGWSLSSGVTATPASIVGGLFEKDATNEEDHGIPRNSVRAVSVNPGDTLWAIAKKHHVDVHQLRALNHITDNRIVVGQALWVPVGRTSRSTVSGSVGSNP
jgi:LysM repeat protein